MISNMFVDRIESDLSTPRQAKTDHGSILRTQAEAAERFAAACANLPGVRVLRDVALNEVSLSFGDRTQDIHDRLYRRGHRVRLTEWRTQKMLRVSFTDHKMAEGLAAELFDSLAYILGEMAVADARIW
jgi:hypothetical protein